MAKVICRQGPVDSSAKELDLLLFGVLNHRQDNLVQELVLRVGKGFESAALGVQSFMNELKLCLDTRNGVGPQSCQSEQVEVRLVLRWLMQ